MIVGYILSRYPLLSETFILREMWELERQGQRLFVYPLRRVKGKRHLRVAQLRAPVRWLPWLAWRAHGYWLRRRPWAYAGTLAAVLWRNRGDANLWLGALAYWGKAVSAARQMQQDGVEHVHAHYATHPALAAYIVQRLTGIPYSVTVHAHDIFCHRVMLAHKIRAARVVVAISQFNRILVERVVPPPRPPVVVVHCGIENKVYSRMAAGRVLAADAATWRRPERQREGAVPPLRILAVGSLEPYKGHRVLVEACAILRERGAVFVCRIVGGGQLMGRLRRQVRRLGLERHVWLEGAANEAEVIAVLQWAEVFAMPSIRARSGKMEGLPVALMEAMASGLPVVASRLSGIPELVEHERNGLLVTPGDAAELAAALWRLDDGPRRLRWGAHGRQKTLASFDLSVNAARLAELWAPAPQGLGEAAA
ncbi:MAG: glycosyltransferase [Terriglobales bacterium]